MSTEQGIPSGSDAADDGGFDLETARQPADPELVYSFGPFVLDVSQKRLSMAGEVVRIRPKVLDLLCVLLQNDNRIVRREKVLESIWGKGYHVSDATVNHCIFTLRKILSKQDIIYLETIRGVGLRLIGPVQVYDQEQQDGRRVWPGEPEALAGQAEGSQPLLERLRGASARARGLMAIGVAAVLVALALAGRLYLAPEGERKLVLVLDFIGFGVDPALAWQGTAIRELLHAELADASELVTLGAEGLRDLFPEPGPLLKGRPTREQLSRVHSYTGAELVAYGSYLVVQLHGAPGLRVDAQLVNTISGSVVAATSAEGSLEQLPRLAAEIGAELRQRLGMSAARIGAPAVDPGFPRSGATLRLYSVALEHLRAERLHEAKEILHAVVREEHTAPLPHLALSSIWRKLGYDRKAAEEARRALELADGLNRETELQVQASLHVAENDWRQAEEVYSALWRFFPESPRYGLALGYSQLRVGAPEAALETLSRLRARKADPRVDLLEAEVANHLGELQREKEAALRAIEKARQLDSLLLEAEARLILARAERNLGNYENVTTQADLASELFSAAMSQRGQAEVIRLRAGLAAQGGQLAEAERLYRQVLQVEREMGWLRGVGPSLSSIADIKMEQGHVEEALSLLDEAAGVFREIGDERGLGRTLLHRGMLLTVVDPGQGEPVFREAIEAFDRLQLDVLAANGRSLLASLMIELGKAEEAVELAAVAERKLSHLEHKEGLATACSVLAAALSAAGRLHEAADAVERADRLVEEIGFFRLRPGVLVSRSKLAAFAGRSQESVDLAVEAVEAMRRRGDPVSMYASHQLWVAELLIANGDASAGERLVLEIIGEVLDEAPPSVVFNATMLRARALGEQGRLDEAFRLISEDLKLPVRSPVLEMKAEMTRAFVLWRRGEPAAAIAMLEETVKRAAADGNRPVLIEASIALAEIEMEIGRSETARRRLIDLDVECEQSGFLAAASRARELLRRAGAASEA